MEFPEDNNRLGLLHSFTSVNLTSSSSVYFSANQSPFVSPTMSMDQLPEQAHSEIQHDSMNQRVKPIISNSSIRDAAASLAQARRNSLEPTKNPTCPVPTGSQMFNGVSSSTGISSSTLSSHMPVEATGYVGYPDKRKNSGRSLETSYTLNSASLSGNRTRSCDIFIGLHGQKLSLLRFVNWLQSDLELQGLSCFLSDRTRCRNSRQRGIADKAMDISTFGVVILTRQSLQNPYTIEELLFFTGKKNLVPIYFDLSPSDCLSRDIIERRGELWEKHGGELWLRYGGLRKDWVEAIHALSRADEWKLEAHDGNWRDCIFRAVTLMAARLGRISIVDRLSKWREKVEKEELPFPRNENFIGRKKELSELEFMLLGDAKQQSERDYLELKARPRQKNITLGWNRNGSVEERHREAHMDSGSRKGKEPIVWSESEQEIAMYSSDSSHVRKQPLRSKTGRRYGRRKRSSKVLYGKGIACVSGESGIGKTELLLEFAYRFHQRYKMILWIGGESRYLRQNYLNLWSFLDVDVGICSERSSIISFEEHEEAAIFRVRKELMRNIPFLVIIDNLESEKDWWDHKVVMDLLPRFGGETHCIISTRLPRVLNMDPLKLSYLSGVEAMSLMQGSPSEQPVAEVDALRIIEEKLGRLTLGLAIVGAILSELPINPSRLLDTINRMPLRDFTWNGRNGHLLKQNTFLFQLLEVCFSIFDHADGPRSLAVRMVEVGGWFAPSPTPVSLLALAAHRIPEKHLKSLSWKNFAHSLTCGLLSSRTKRSESEAALLLIRFNIARSSNKQGSIYFNDLIKFYAQRRVVPGVARTMVRAVMSNCSVSDHSDQLWAACFLIFGFSNDPIMVELKVSELLFVVKEVVLPLAIRTFITFSRCRSALELLRLCTDALEVAEQAFVTPVEKWIDKSLCWRPIQSNAQLNPYLWQELALTRATVLETRAKLMLRGGQFEIADVLIRKAVYVRTSICGEDHPDTVAAVGTLGKITRLIANIQTHTL